MNHSTNKDKSTCTYFTIFKHKVPPHKQNTPQSTRIQLEKRRTNHGNKFTGFVSRNDRTTQSKEKLHLGLSIEDAWPSEDMLDEVAGS